MTPSQWLRTAQADFFSGADAPTLADCLRGIVEHRVYCRALFHIKAAIGCHPAETLHGFMSSTAGLNPAAAFIVAIALAEAQERTNAQ